MKNIVPKCVSAALMAIGLSIAMCPLAACGDDTTKIVPAAEGTYDFEITAPSGSRLTYHGFTPSDSWLSFSRWSLSGGQMKLSFHVSENTSATSRTATFVGVVFNDETMVLTVIQEGKSQDGQSTDGGGGGNGNAGVGGLTQTKTVGYAAGTGTFAASSETGTIGIPNYTSSANWLTTPRYSTSTSKWGGWSIEVTFAVTENPSSEPRTAVLTGTANGATVAQFTVVQEGNPSSPSVPDPTPTPSPAPVIQNGFGPGEASDFKISASERGYVVGVYGLTWKDFPKRSADNCNVFTDSAIVDREKRSGGFSAADYDFCVDYSFVDLFVWTGWSSMVGFADEDAFGEALVDGSGWGALDELHSLTAAYQEEIPTGSTFAKTLEDRMADANGIMAMTVWFDNFKWYGKKYSGTPGLGHGIVCCGYSYDPGKSSTDPTWLKGLFIIESDNDRENGSGGASAPDTITYCPVKWNSSKKRYYISNIFGAEGYFDDKLGGGGVLLRTKDSVALHKSTKGDDPDPIDEVSGEFDLTASKAQTAKGLLYDADGALAGTVEVKLGKINAKKRTASLSASITMVDGKKVSAKAVTVPVDNGTSTVLKFKAPVGDMAFDMNGDGWFSLAGGEYSMAEGSAGGNLPNGTMWFSVDIGDLPDFGEGWDVLYDALPDGVELTVTGGKKLDAGKAASIKYKKDKDAGETWYYLDGLDDEKKPNRSGLKITYTPKTGIFKGSFSVYATNADYIDYGKQPKLKKYTVNFTGIFLNDEDGTRGYGQATMKKPAAGPWTVTVE